jgi:DNA invertase Pin-like site-specific DNA recombinase
MARAATALQYRRLRCAVYTRKSSEEGLEQEFNSLHAQREACEAFIRSQRHEGWVCLPQPYDDGGCSGGTMDRPALQRLLVDIGEGKVDVVVTYKIDRLTRSLRDFAKITEIFEARGVSFVSVTQQFNTTTSMGRLTLNVLLSFAQFEREVAVERIRDKIAASKKKGWWMGGMPPLGYRVEDRKLVVIPGEAETVRHIFRRYVALGSVRLLQQELETRGVTSKRWTSSSGRHWGGKPIARGALYLLLQNRIYRGEIVHKEQHYPGEHQAIIDPELWEATQVKLAANAVERSTGIGAGRLAVRCRRQPHDADPCGQERPSLPILCLPPANHRGAGKITERDARAGPGDRATRHRADPASVRGSCQPDRGDRTIRAAGCGAARSPPASRRSRCHLVDTAADPDPAPVDHPGPADRLMFGPDRIAHLATPAFGRSRHPGSSQGAG